MLNLLTIEPARFHHGLHMAFARLRAVVLELVLNRLVISNWILFNSKHDLLVLSREWMGMWEWDDY